MYYCVILYHPSIWFRCFLLSVPRDAASFTHTRTTSISFNLGNERSSLLVPFQFRARLNNMTPSQYTSLYFFHSHCLFSHMPGLRVYRNSAFIFDKAQIRQVVTIRDNALCSNNFRTFVLWGSKQKQILSTVPW